MQSGKSVASLLAGAWRVAPASGSLSAAEFAQATPLLLDGGAGALGWWRVRLSALARTHPARLLRDAFRVHGLQAAVHENTLLTALHRLRSAGLDPILIKGWSMARLYPEAGLRPYGDHDLCLPAEQLSAALEILARNRADCGSVELHAGIPDLPDRLWHEVYHRSQHVPLGKTTIRVLGAEDMLRLQCVHFVRHGGNRPLWLCDIALLLEMLPVDFDWDYCLSGNRQLSDWVRAICSLACHLLRVENIPAVLKADLEKLPRWLVQTLLWRWGMSRERQPWQFYWQQPREALRSLYYHGLNPMRSNFQLGLSPYTRWPVPFFQLAGWAVLYSQRLRGIFSKRFWSRPNPIIHHNMAPLALARYSVRSHA